MKTKHLFGLVAVVAVAGFAASAEAGWSVDISFGLPVRFEPPVVVACPPPVRYCPPPVVYVPSPCAPTVYIAPRYERHHDYRGHDRDRRDQRGWGNDRDDRHFGGRR